MLKARNICALLWISFVHCEIMDFGNNVESVFRADAPSFSFSQFKKPTTNFLTFNPPNTRRWNMPNNNQIGQNLVASPTSSFPYNLPENHQPTGFDPAINPALNQNKLTNGHHNMDCAFQNSQLSSSLISQKAQPNYFSAPNPNARKFYVHPRPLHYPNIPYSYNNMQQPQVNTFQNLISQSVLHQQDHPHFSTNDISGQMQNVPNDLSLAALTVMKLKHPSSSVSIQQLLKDLEQKMQNKNIPSQQHGEQHQQPEQDKRENLLQPEKFEIVFSSNPTKQFQDPLQFQHGAIQHEETVSTIVNDTNDYKYGSPSQTKVDSNTVNL